MLKVLQLVLVTFITIQLSYAQGVSLSAKTYLQSALPSNFESTSDGTPLMTDYLRSSPYTSERYLPNADPYSIPTEYTGFITEFYNHVGNGGLTANTTITSPDDLFEVFGRDAIVDWVFVEVRASTEANSTVATRAALLQRDGDIVAIDGQSPLNFDEVQPNDYYVVVRHRNHLGIMTSDLVTLSTTTTSVDFTDPLTSLWDLGTSIPGRDYTNMSTDFLNSGSDQFRVMWCGDFNADGRVKYNEPKSDLNMLFLDVIGFDTNVNQDPNFTGAHGYFQSDKDMNGMIKFDSPNDDRIALMNTVRNYTLNKNSDYNYDHFIEQLLR